MRMRGSTTELEIKIDRQKSTVQYLCAFKRWSKLVRRILYFKRRISRILIEILFDRRWCNRAVEHLSALYISLQNPYPFTIYNNFF